jgi:hypothetical protein
MSGEDVSAPDGGGLSVPLLDSRGSETGRAPLSNGRGSEREEVSP